MKNRLLLHEFLDAVDAFDRADAEHAALTEALSRCYDMLDDQSKHDAQKAFPQILRESKNVTY